MPVKVEQAEKSPEGPSTEAEKLASLSRNSRTKRSWPTNFTALQGVERSLRIKRVKRREGGFSKVEAIAEKGGIKTHIRGAKTAIKGQFQPPKGV